MSSIAELADHVAECALELKRARAHRSEINRMECSASNAVNNAEKKLAEAKKTLDEALTKLGSA